ncbi:MAG TPA: XDD4 family exosortase-dependent surface protein [Armatimonadota bacterium]|jgi:hypothetical protein
MTRSIRVLTAATLAMAAALQAKADSVTYTSAGTNGATGSALAATAVMTLSSGQLFIDLTNTGAPAKAPSDALMALLFTVSPSLTLTPVSAALKPGSTFTNPAAYSLGQEWQYRSGISGPGSTNAGISAAGLGLFSAANFAPGGQNLQGMDYGIVNGVSSSANSPTQSAVFVNNSARFTFSAPNVELADISNVAFQFGTALDEPRLPGTPDPPSPPAVPEPGALALVGCGALGALPMLRRRR